MGDLKSNYIKFDEEELATFCQIMDHEKRKSISFVDIESACRQLGLEDIYPNIRDFIREIGTSVNGEVTLDELNKGLLKNRTDPVDEMREMFRHLDFRKCGKLNQNHLQIMITDITGEKISNVEAEEMIQLLASNEKEITEEDFLKLLSMKINI